MAGGTKDIVGTVKSQLENGINANQVKIYTNDISQGQTGGFTSMAPKQIGFNNTYQTKEGGILDDATKYKIVSENKLKTGDYFQYEGKKYKVKNAVWTRYGLGAIDVVAQRAAGGPVSAGSLYRVNETNMEFFQPNFNGKILPSGSYPLGASYNIPSSAPSSVSGSSAGVS